MLACRVLLGLVTTWIPFFFFFWRSLVSGSVRPFM